MKKRSQSVRGTHVPRLVFGVILPVAIAVTGCGRLESAELPESSDDEPTSTGVLNAAFVVAETVFNSELMAPYDILHHTKYRDGDNYIRPFIVSEDGGSFTTFEGLQIDAHYAFDDHPRIDILVIPSTDNSMSADLENKRYIGWIKHVASEASYVVTLCDGAFALAATGLLDGRSATTFPSDRDRLAAMFDQVDVRHDVNFVVDDQFITSAGGALSYEPALYLVERLYSVESAQRTAGGLVIDWDLDRIPHYVTP